MRAAILFTAIALSASVAHAQARAQSAPRSRDKDVTLRELLQIEEEIAKANRDCDYRYFDRVEADEFIFTDNAGGVTTKQEDLAGEKNCRKSTNPQVVGHSSRIPDAPR